MSQTELLKMLDYFDREKIWIFNINMVKTYFYHESEHLIRISLSRHVKNGILKRIAKGLYINIRSKNMPTFKLEHIAGYIRDIRTIYLSFESVLSSLGIISQIPMRLTFVSKEKNAVFNTPYGTIEFTKTSQDFNLFSDNFYFDKDKNIFIATKQQAIKDAYRFRRNIDLIQEQEAKNAN